MNRRNFLSGLITAPVVATLTQTPTGWRSEPEEALSASEEAEMAAHDMIMDWQGWREDD